MIKYKRQSMLFRYSHSIFNWDSRVMAIRRRDEENSLENDSISSYFLNRIQCLSRLCSLLLFLLDLFLYSSWVIGEVISGGCRLRWKKQSTLR